MILSCFSILGTKVKICDRIFICPKTEKLRWASFVFEILVIFVNLFLDLVIHRVYVSKELRNSAMEGIFLFNNITIPDFGYILF